MNFILIADIKNRAAIAPLENALSRIGTNFRLNALVWLLHCESSAGAVRNELVQHLGNTDSLLIADAGSGKTAWFNLAPEIDARIRKLWQRPTI